MGDIKKSRQIYSNSFVNYRVSVISALALFFQIQFPKRRELLNGVVLLKHLQFHELYLKVKN